MRPGSRGGGSRKGLPGLIIILGKRGGEKVLSKKGRGRDDKSFQPSKGKEGKGTGSYWLRSKEFGGGRKTPEGRGDTMLEGKLPSP